MGVFGVGGTALIVPSGPGQALVRHHAGVGVQHGAVGLKTNLAEHVLLGCARLAQQAQRLIRMGGNDDFIKRFHALGGEQAHAVFIPLNALHRRVQTLVVNVLGDGLHVVLGAALHREPLWSVVHLQEAVVVTKPHHGGGGELQHLRGGATPNATQHGQQITITESAAKPMCVQKILQRLHQGAVVVRLGQRGGQFVEAHNVGQQAPKLRAQQIAALREHAVEIRPVPLELLATGGPSGLNRERHVRVRGLHTQLRKQINQARVGAFVVDQKAGVHAMCGEPLRTGQADVDRVAVAAEIAARFKQADAGVAPQMVRRRQTGNARADDGHTLVHVRGFARPRVCPLRSKSLCSRGRWCC